LLGRMPGCRGGWGEAKKKRTRSPRAVLCGNIESVCLATDRRGEGGRRKQEGRRNAYLLPCVDPFPTWSHGTRERCELTGRVFGARPRSGGAGTCWGGAGDAETKVGSRYLPRPSTWAGVGSRGGSTLVLRSVRLRHVRYGSVSGMTGRQDDKRAVSETGLSSLDAPMTACGHCFCCWCWGV
jgi:hypothetical protein